MAVCPFCKTAVPQTQTAAPCPRCGRAPGAPGSTGLSPGEDAAGGAVPDLVLESHRAVPGPPRPPASGTTPAAGLAAYDSGRSLDDELFDEGDAGPLELDIPASSRSRPSASGAVPVAPGSGPAPASSPAVLRPSGSHPLPGTSGTHPAARPLAPDASSPGAIPGAGSSGRVPVALPPASSAPRDVGAPGSAPDAAVPPAAPSSRARPDAGALLVARYPPPPAKVWHAPVYACIVLYRQLELRRDLESLRRRRSPDVPLYEAALRAHDPRAYAIGLAITGVCLALFLVAFFMPVILRFARAPG